MYDVAEYALDRNIRPELRSMELGDGIDTSQNALFPSFPHSNPTRARSPTPLRPPAHGVVCRHPIRALRALVHQHAEERIGSYSLPIRNAERRDSGHRHHRRIVDAAVTLHRKSAALARIFAPGDRHVAKKYILLLLVLHLL